MAVPVGRGRDACREGLAVVGLGDRGAGQRHVVGDRGLVDGQLAGLLGHVVVGGDVLAAGLDGQLAGEGAVVAARLGALGAVGEALPGLAVDQALDVDAGELVDGAAVFLGARLAGEGGRALGDGERQFQGAQLHLVALGGHQQAVAARIGGRGVQISVCGHAIGHGGFLPCVAQLPAGHGVGLNNSLGSVIRHRRAIVDLRPCAGLVGGHLIATARDKQLHVGDRNGLDRKLQGAVALGQELVVEVVAGEARKAVRPGHHDGVVPRLLRHDAHSRGVAHSSSYRDAAVAVIFRIVTDIDVVGRSVHRVVLDGHIAREV